MLIIVETNRNPSTNNQSQHVEAVSSNIDDKTLHELYLWPFQDAVHAGSGNIMCSYNRINNSYGCQNSKMLNGVLKDELGFQGFVVSDWGALHAGYAAAEAGLDMVMPNAGVFWAKNLTAAINNGTMNETILDNMATRYHSNLTHHKETTDLDQNHSNLVSILPGLCRLPHTRHRPTQRPHIPAHLHGRQISHLQASPPRRRN